MYGVDMYSEGCVVTHGVIPFGLSKAVVQALSRQRAVAYLRAPLRTHAWWVGHLVMA
jgi:hypothetical protein